MIWLLMLAVLLGGFGIGFFFGTAYGVAQEQRAQWDRVWATMRRQRSLS